MFADVCAFGISLLSVLELERWLEGTSPIEACCTYACVFSLLEFMRYVAAEPSLSSQCLTNNNAAAKMAQGVALVAQGGAGAGLELDLQDEADAALLVLW
jgi:hypothetical protein